VTVREDDTVLTAKVRVCLTVAVVFLSAGLFPAQDLLAAGPVLPAPVRPGAVQPDRELNNPIPQVRRPGPAEPILEEAAASTMEVLPVVDRPLDIDEGEKVQVSAFHLKGVVDRKKFGIAQADIQALLDGKLAARPDGFSVGRLQEVADGVTQYYRNKGLILAQAFIPVQTIENGEVTIEVLEGRLGRVLAEGNEKYDDTVLQRPFDGLLGQPVTKETIEAALLRLSDYPGLSLFGVFQPGQQVGSADMVMKVQKEDRFDASFRFDNHGQQETGRRRTLVDFAWNNITGGADRLHLILQKTHQPSNSFFQFVEYERPIISPEYLFHLDYSKNAFDVGGEFRAQDIYSDTVKGKVSLKRSFIRSRERNLSAEVGFSRKHSRTKVRSRETSKDSLTELNLSLTFDSVDAQNAGLNSGYAEFTHGFNDLFGAMGNQTSVSSDDIRPSRRGGSGQFATGEFNKAFLALSRLQSLSPLGDKFKQQSLLLRSEFQWTKDRLVPLEQYAIGGPNNVRAYAPTEELFDKAYFLSLEWIINAPGFADKPAFGNHNWGELLQFSLFYDTASGKKNDALPSGEVESRNYNGYGFGLSFNNPNVFTSRLTLGYPLSSPDAKNRRHPQYWLDLTYFF